LVVVLPQSVASMLLMSAIGHQIVLDCVRTTSYMILASAARWSKWRSPQQELRHAEYHVTLNLIQGLAYERRRC
jgi:hypothetical protein